MAVNKPELGNYIINDPNQRKEQGIGRNYVDDWNQARMQEYNNDYNYWAWIQQQEYNTPLNQRKRLEEAGLNPNYNSVDSGNVSALAASNGKLSGNAASNRNASIGNAIASVNAMLKGISDGFDNYKKLATSPSLGMLDSFRQAYTENIKSQAGLTTANKVGKMIDNAFQSVVKGVDPDQLGTDEVRSSPAFTQQTLQNDTLASLILYRKNIVENMTPAQLAEINQRMAQSRAYIEYLGSNVAVNSGRIKFMDAQKDFYKSAEYLNYSKELNTFEHTKNLEVQRGLVLEQARKLKQEIKNLGQQYDINKPKGILGDLYGTSFEGSVLYPLAKFFKFY